MEYLWCMLVLYNMAFADSQGENNHQPLITQVLVDPVSSTPSPATTPPPRGTAPASTSPGSSSANTRAALIALGVVVSITGSAVVTTYLVCRCREQTKARQSQSRVLTFSPSAVSKCESSSSRTYDYADPYKVSNVWKEFLKKSSTSDEDGDYAYTNSVELGIMRDKTPTENHEDLYTSVHIEDPPAAGSYSSHRDRDSNAYAYASANNQISHFCNRPNSLEQDSMQAQNKPMDWREWLHHPQTPSTRISSSDDPHSLYAQVGKQSLNVDNRNVISERFQNAAQVNALAESSHSPLVGTGALTPFPFAASQQFPLGLHVRGSKCNSHHNGAVK